MTIFHDVRYKSTIYYGVNRVVSEPGDSVTANSCSHYMRTGGKGVEAGSRVSRIPIKLGGDPYGHSSEIPGTFRTSQHIDLKENS